MKEQAKKQTTDNNFPWWLFDFFQKEKFEKHDCISELSVYY
jgi:hypothetical protein